MMIYLVIERLGLMKKKSLVWKVSAEELQQIIYSCETLADILRKLNLKPSGNYKTLKTRLNSEKFDFSHIKLGLDTNKGRKLGSTNKIPLNQILVENSTYLGGGRTLKPRLIKAGLLENKCYKCNIGPEWNGEKLSLQLDHINGVHNDNRIDNLRLLCPNCHSQTPTFSGRNINWRPQRESNSC